MLYIFKKKIMSSFQVGKIPQIYHSFEDEAAQIQCLYKNSGGTSMDQ